MIYTFKKSFKNASFCLAFFLKAFLNFKLTQSITIKKRILIFLHFLRENGGKNKDSR